MMRTGSLGVAIGVQSYQVSTDAQCNECCTPQQATPNKEVTLDTLAVL